MRRNNIFAASVSTSECPPPAGLLLGLFVRMQLQEDPTLSEAYPKYVLISATYSRSIIWTYSARSVCERYCINHTGIYLRLRMLLRYNLLFAVCLLTAVSRCINQPVYDRGDGQVAVRGYQYVVLLYRI